MTKIRDNCNALNATVCPLPRHSHNYKKKNTNKNKNEIKKHKKIIIQKHKKKGKYIKHGYNHKPKLETTAMLWMQLSVPGQSRPRQTFATKQSGLESFKLSCFYPIDKSPVSDHWPIMVPHFSTSETETKKSNTVTSLVECQLNKNSVLKTS